jgi:hypothetical protein
MRQFTSLTISWVIFQRNIAKKNQPTLMSIRVEPYKLTSHITQSLFCFWIIIETSVMFFMRTKWRNVLQCCKIIPVTKSCLQKASSFWLQGQSCLLRLEASILNMPNSFSPYLYEFGHALLWYLSLS